MNRKFRELIPLFAIGLMIIGAIALLIAMNSDGNNKKAQLKNENKTETKLEENVKDDISKPVASLDEKDEEVNDDKVSLDEEKNEVKDDKENNEEVSDNKNATTNINTNKDNNANKDYIQSMVDELLGSGNSSNSSNGLIVQGSNSNNQSSNNQNNTNTQTGNNTNNSNVSNNNATSNPVITKPQPSQTLTQSQVQKAKATAYTILKSVNVGGYTVSTTTSNNIISYNSGNKVVVSVLNSGNVGILKVFNNYVYAYETKSGLVKTYSLYNGKLSLISRVDMGSCRDFVLTNTYLFVLKEDSRLYAYKVNNGIVEQAQSGFVMESGGIQSISSASGSSISVRTKNGNTTRYTFNGVNFEK